MSYLSRPSKALLKGILAATILILSCFALPAYAQSGLSGHSNKSATGEPGTPRAEAIFAGGCFWCVEQAFEEHPGVIEAVSGFTGGKQEDPSYREVASGKTEHREAVRVIYNPKRTGYADLLRVFWTNIDPYDGKGQFCDRGAQYSSAIYFKNPEQEKLARKSKALLSDYPGTENEIVIPVIKASQFYEAEDNHQDYYKENSLRYNFYKSLCGRESRLEEVWTNVPVKKILAPLEADKK